METEAKKKIKGFSLGAGSVGVIAFLVNYVSVKEEGLRADTLQRIQSESANMRQYVDLKNENIINMLNDMKATLKGIDERLYRIHRYQQKQEGE